MPRTTSTLDRSKQTKAAAKRSRLQEAGLGGRRTGKASARTRAAQARRDGRAQTKTSLLKAATGIGGSDTAARPKGSAVAARRKASSPAQARKQRATPMIEVRTTSAVAGSASLDAQVQQVVSAGLSRFSAQLTRIDVYLTDDNAAKKGPNDKRCRIEARPASQRAVSVSATSSTVEKALASAVGKMQRLLASRLARRARR